MSAHYDRPPVPYATRHSPAGAAPRGDVFYERDTRAVFAPPEVDHLPDDRLPLRRDERALFVPQEYAPPPRDVRTEHWVRIDPWYHANYPRLQTPPPPQAYPAEYQAYGPSPHPPWGAHNQWEVDPDARDYESNVAWRHHHEPSSSRLSSILNPAPSHTLDDRRWRDIEAPHPHAPPHREYVQEYPLNYYPYDYTADPYHERVVYDEPDVYRPHHLHDERVPAWGPPIYRPPSPVQPSVHRINRPSYTREHRRSRQLSTGVGQSPRVSELGTPVWTRENGTDSSRNSREGSLSSPIHAVAPYRERIPSGPPQIIQRGVLPPAARAPPRPSWEGPVDGAVRTPTEERGKVARPFHSPKLIPNEASRILEKARHTDLRDVEQAAASGSTVTSPRGKPLAASPKPIEYSGNDRVYPTVDDRSSWNSRALQAVSNAQNVKEKPRDSARRFSPALEALPARSPSRQSPTFASGPTELPASQPQTSASPRKSIMSVKSLVTPTPNSPMAEAFSNLKEREIDSSRRATPPNFPSSTFPSPPPSRPQSYMPKNGSQTDATPDEREKPSYSSEKLSPPATLPDKVPEKSATEPPRSVSPSPDRSGSSESSEHVQIASLESSAVGRSLAVTPQIPNEVDEVDARVAETHIQSPTPAVTPPRSPSTKKTFPSSAKPIVPFPRPKADGETIRNTLRRAIIARREFSIQTKDERVNPIFLENLSKVDEPIERVSTSPEQTIKEVLNRIFAQDKEEQHMNTRSVLAANFAEQQELLAEKTQGLRKEYLRLHEAWIAHCANLDSLFKANDASDAIAVTGRTTRRSAAGLGGAVRSDLEMERLIATLGNEDLMDPNHLAVRNVATIPDMICVVKGKVEYNFDDRNGRVSDPASFYDARSGFHDWTPDEEKLFYEKYAEFPKQFGSISSFLSHKTTSQCVLYYYLRKKRLIDFRNAVNVNNGRRRRGGGGARKAGKQKSNALLADVQQADSKRPGARRGRRGRGGTAESSRGKVGGPLINGDQDTRPKRRRLTVPRVVLETAEAEEASIDTDQTREPSISPVKKRRGRKPKMPEGTFAVTPVPSLAPDPSAVPSPAPSLIPGTPYVIGETRFVEGLTRRFRSANLSSYWTDADRDEFLRLLSRHGKDFKRIASSMPNKTTIQVSNYFKSHLKEWNLDAVAAAASARSRSESPNSERPPSSSRDIISRIRTARNELGGSALGDFGERQVSDAAAGVSSMTLENGTAQNYGRIGPIANSSTEDAFETAGRYDSHRGTATSTSSHHPPYSSHFNNPSTLLHSSVSLLTAQQQYMSSIPSASLSSFNGSREWDRDRHAHPTNLNPSAPLHHGAPPVTLSLAHPTNLSFITGISGVAGNALSFAAPSGKEDLSQQVQQIPPSGTPAYEDVLRAPASLHMMMTAGMHFAVPHTTMQAEAGSSNHDA